MILRRANASFEGREAQRVLGVMLAALNGFSGSQSNVDAAVARVENAPTVNQLVTMMSDDDVARSRKRVKGAFGRNKWTAMLLNDMPPSLRLALEMSLNEESERRALNGELVELETRWRQAEEIAAISDGLFVSANTNDKIEEMHD